MESSPEFTPGTTQPAVELPWLAEIGGRPWVLHVGTCITRKRIDVLLDVVAAVRETVPDLRLVKVGGEWTADHRERIARLGLAGAITHVTGLTRVELAEVYRRAAVVLVPSGAEGFGLPVIEALACGAAVVASDIPALREAGGPAAAYAPVGDVGAWSDAGGEAAHRPGRRAAAGRSAGVGGAFHLDGPRGDHRPGVSPAPPQLSCLTSGRMLATSQRPRRMCPTEGVLKCELSTSIRSARSVARN